MSKLSDPELSWRPLYSAEKKVVLSCFEAALLRRRTAQSADRNVLEDYMRRIEVPGFRPGKAPTNKLAGGLAALCFHRRGRALTHNKEISLVFQAWRFLARATALHNVELPLIYNGTPAAQRLEDTSTGSGRRGAGSPHDAQAQRAFRRTAPARGRRSCPGQSSLDHPRRPAHGKPRLQDRPGDHGPLRPAPPPRQYHCAGDALSEAALAEYAHRVVDSPRRTDLLRRAVLAPQLEPDQFTGLEVFPH